MEHAVQIFTPGGLFWFRGSLHRKIIMTIAGILIPPFIGCNGNFRIRSGTGIAGNIVPSYDHFLSIWIRVGVHLRISLMISLIMISAIMVSLPFGMDSDSYAGSLENDLDEFLENFFFDAVHCHHTCHLLSNRCPGLFLFTFLYDLDDANCCAQDYAYDTEDFFCFHILTSFHHVIESVSDF